MFWSRVFLPFALGYFISQVFRSVNAVVSADLVRELGLDAWSIGLLTSAYFFAFAGAQLPVGVALDRFGPRRTESALLIVAALGAALFAVAGGARGLTVGRALIGAGVSACLMASFHAFALSSPAHRLPFLNGAVMAVGAAGAATATLPVEWAVESVGFRALFAGLAGATVVGALVVFLTVSEPEKVTQPETLGVLTRGITGVFTSRAFWSVAPFSVAHQGAYLAIQSLWAGPWLHHVAGLSRAEVATRLLTLALSMGAGFIGLGFIAQRLARRGISTVSVWVVAGIVFQVVQACLVLSWTRFATAIWMGFGFFGAAGMLSYAVLTKRFPLQMAGRVNTGLNVFVFAGAFAFQSGIGGLVQHFTPEGASFSPLGFRYAFAAVLALQVLALLWLLLTSSWRDRSQV